MLLTDSYSSTTTADLNKRGFHHRTERVRGVSAAEEAAVPPRGCGAGAAARGPRRSRVAPGTLTKGLFFLLRLKEVSKNVSSLETCNAEKMDSLLVN